MPPAVYGNWAIPLRLLNRFNNIPAPNIEPGASLDTDDNYMVARARTALAGAVSVQRVTQRAFPAGKKAKSNQSWKYPGNNIVRAPTAEINGRYYTDPKEADAGSASQQGQPVLEIFGDGELTGTPRRKQESNFFITINPNQTYFGADEDRARARFVAALQYLSQDEVFKTYLKFGPPKCPNNEHYQSDQPDDVIFPGIEWKANVEIGEKMNRMHAHIICYVEHYSQIQINTQMFQYEFRQAFNEGLDDDDPLVLTTVPYLQVKMLPQADWTTIMKQYIHKGMEARAEQ